MSGRVYLVGAGPGDPGLITVRGLDVLRQADVILYDNLAPVTLLDYARPDAELIYVGKKRADHHLSQDEINALLVEKAQTAAVVVRLKGGDPFIFGRGGEEGEALHAAGIYFEVVPGVSSATGAAAYAGIPLTHRSRTSAISFVTGHEVDAIDWAKVGQTETLVIFMGLTTFGEIAKQLIAGGRDPQTPAAAIRWGTRPDQQTLTGTVANLAERIAAAKLRPPALIIVGEVVALREDLNWFEHLPLFGQRIVLTRAEEQAGESAEQLRRLGAEVIAAPTIEIVEPSSWAAIDAAIANLETYDWLIFTSRNGVERFLARLDASERDLRAVKGRIAAIGPATAEALAQARLKVDCLPEEFVAESLLDAFDAELTGKKILLARAEVAREVLPEGLRRRGASVDVAPVYRTVVPDSATLRRALATKPPDWITFTSSSTVRHFVEMAGVDVLKTARIASIGPITSATIREYGIEPTVEAEPHTMVGLVAAIVGAAG
ncbi:MAG: uroporphyrinogen-III C-methyltransferase [Acidobacteria bacterium]|nr:uroporphyrinogen-III C-methyltransferase [Acidobacteriota bacterium]MDA1236441.1 uroporphyrinogen-III C-methyltransferase [Acidobacteriota bacterium]